MNDRNFAKYLEEIAQASAWGSALEGTAFAMTHDRPVYVFCPGQEQKNFLFNRNGKRKPLFLKYDAASEHYTCLVPDQTFQCPEDVIDGPHCGLRGAAISNGSRPKPGKSPSSTGTRKSVQLRLKKAVSSSDNKCKQSERGACSIGTRPSVQKRLQKHNVPKGNRTFTTNFLDQVRSLSEEACPACPEISAENANSSQDLRSCQKRGMDTSEMCTQISPNQHSIQLGANMNQFPLVLSQIYHNEDGYVNTVTKDSHGCLSRRKG